MKRLYPVIFIAVFVLILNGCTGIGTKDNRVGESTNNSVSVAAKKDLALALEDIKRGETRRAAKRLEALTKNYESTDEWFEQSVLTVLALQYLDLGFRNDFLRTSELLKGSVGKESMMAPETQYVLQISQAMQNQAASELPGYGYDPRLGQAINDLLSE